VTFGAPVARRGRQFLSATHGITHTDGGRFFFFPLMPVASANMHLYKSLLVAL